MNDEYLWQKTGVDPETTRLEEALAVFRNRQDEAPPALPITRAQGQAPRWRFALAYGALAFGALILAVGLWFTIVDRNANYDVTFVHHPVSDTIEQPAEGPAPAVQPTAPAKQPIRRINQVTRSTSASVRRRPVVNGHSRKARIAILTKEERYAYRQLMLALSITGSKLKIVQDTIDGTEDTEDNPSKNHR